MIREIAQASLENEISNKREKKRVSLFLTNRKKSKNGDESIQIHFSYKQKMNVTINLLFLRTTLPSGTFYLIRILAVAGGGDDGFCTSNRFDVVLAVVWCCLWS